MSFAYRVSAYNRQRKWDRFVELIRPTPELTILDVGYSDREYSATDNFLEKHYPYPKQITALGIDEPVEFPRRYPQVKVVQYDGVDFPFEDQQFDVCWSNAVIEHVGNRDRQVKFASEIRRVSKCAFVTTPNRFFPIEVHTRTPLLHYLPKRWFDPILRATGRGWATGDYMHLLSEQALRSILSEAGVVEPTILKNRLGGFTLDFIALWGQLSRRPGEQAEPVDPAKADHAAGETESPVLTS
jgi:SAM-dependent methyltransferase